ncbi:hypothetical protein EX895_001391 [Sporisorium graminicola]|uniref:Uncharacterized protein n=1 Tax=Sporisorium graminicola TaxID=280036 RepID=A0A4U7KZ00_9BASI|nr:hypothetical protein EX895_001391 [Sporisorium graminicola]TKY89606.1 hypothetical protein EX895_001391 [Sporisorium graminicola]
MARPRLSLPPGTVRSRPPKRGARPNSFLSKHYALFKSLTRYTLDEPAAPSPPSRKRSLAANQALRFKARKLDRLRQRYPVGGVSSYAWPVPFSPLRAYSQEPSERVDELVHQVVRDTFDADYAMFRSPAWVKEHRITKDHLQHIIIDPNQVDESAAAAKALVESVLGKFISGVKRGSIGTSDSAAKFAVKGKDVRSSSEATTAAASEMIQEPQTTSPIVDAATKTVDPKLNEAELDEEIGQVDGYTLDWRDVLDYLQSKAASSKSTQWRNWHLLAAIIRTRQRCEQLFGHQPS